MKVNFYPPSNQASGNFNFGEILEKSDWFSSRWRTIEDFNFKKGDFFTISNTKNILLNTQKASKLFEISSPIKPSYKTYFN